MDLGILFQGFGTLASQEPRIAVARIVLIFLGILLVYLGKKGTLEPLIMIPMGFGMAAVNSGVLFFSATNMGTLFVNPLVSDTEGLMSTLQIDFLQPIYNFAFSNSLIACIVFMGVGVWPMWVTFCVSPLPVCLLLYLLNLARLQHSRLQLLWGLTMGRLRQSLLLELQMGQWCFLVH